MTREVERTDDGRYLVVDGRRWRTADPDLPTTSEPGCCTTSARPGPRCGPPAGRGDDAGVAAARGRVPPAKVGLGERWTTALRELDR